MNSYQIFYIIIYCNSGTHLKYSCTLFCVPTICYHAENSIKITHSEVENKRKNSQCSMKYFGPKFLYRHTEWVKTRILMGILIFIFNDEILRKMCDFDDHYHNWHAIV